ncbi:M14 family metallocarboxypeptidase [Verrucomicrobiaceae bacterium 5K15]|uniref:M14 family metallocarboxypeptidase n=1 Tax=Oceaniferula flava TaxID=2800421 RepID=A0AAE2SC66_9BACT|nr:M14 family metallocarboxypeptidase [Oceaniferula flavus]MBK1855109.1 M14 family metallocarboxypeptidase [Oceaniferula flavus]MBM1136415.1 M14 family metallocarboxypeptidase [Oceaniferula flavus]
MSIDVQAYLEEFHREASARGFVGEVMAEVAGYNIPAYSKQAEGKELVYLSAGCHGDEPSGVHAMLELLQEGAFDDRFSWLVCPLLNPTGLAAGTRENAEGLDLNRDYLKKQSAEVRGHVAWLERQQVPSLLVSLHEDWESTGFYLYEIQKHVCRSTAKAILEAASEVIITEPSPIIDDHAVREPGWIFHQPQADFPDQWPEAIFMAERGATVSYTLETPSSRPLKDRVRCHKLTVLRAIDELRLTQGGAAESNCPE